MKRVRMHLSPGEVHPMYRLLTDSPHVERATALTWNVTGDGILTMLHRLRGDVDRIEAAVEGIEHLREFELIRLSGSAPSADRSAGGTAEEAYLYLRDEGTDDSRVLFDLLSSDGLLAVPPIEYDETGASFTVIGEEWALQAAHESVPDRFDVTVEGVGSPAPALESTGTAGLSERQREAARAGVDLGYFDVPRTASHEDVARALECSPSTAAEHLQKAQSKLVRAAVGSGDGPKRGESTPDDQSV